MPSSEYYHRQADLCVRMALSADAYEGRVRLLDMANEYRARATHAEGPAGSSMLQEWSSRSAAE